MPGTKEIKRRIKSVKNTKKITKAMELVAASKMKRALASTLASRVYAEYSFEILTSISKKLAETKHPLFINHEQKEINAKENILVVLITSNRGLCGAYNAQIIKKIISLLKLERSQVDFISVGKKGDTAMRMIGKNIIASFMELSDNISLADVLPISKLAMDEYAALHYDRVLIAYTDFVSALMQRPNIKQILPISQNIFKDLQEFLKNTDQKTQKPEEVPAVKRETDYLFEGDFDELIEMLALKITRMQIYQMLLESNASEQSSRMLAMKNASDASSEMINDLTLVFNKARQANITREISEISAGMASVN